MKLRNPRFLPVILLMLAIQASTGTSSLKAQTTLASGDILFTSYNGVPSAGTAPDTFSFVVLVPVSATTVIYFTERGYQGGTTWQASGGTEGTISWTVGSALTIGKEVTIAGLGASAARVDGSANGTVAIVSGGNITTGLSLSNAGDQIMAFQGASGDPTSGAAVFISGINWALSCGTTTDAGWNGAGCTYGPQSSALPPGLVGGTTALLMGTAGAAPNNSHGKFNCGSTPATTVAAIKAAVLNKSNWVFSSSASTTFDIPGGCAYLGSLPVSWLQVRGTLNEKSQALITWVVNEAEVKYYEIEKSTDGVIYSPVIIINSRGNGENSYQYEAGTLTKLCYFRIKQTDIDGKFTYSTVIKLNAPEIYRITVYPQPAKDVVNITVNSNLLNTRVQLVDIKGISLQSFRITNTNFTLNLSGYTNGVYMLKCENGQTEKIVKQ